MSDGDWYMAKRMMDLRVVEDWQRLVTGAEVEDLAPAAVEAAATAEYLAALEPANEYQCVRIGYIEPFAVHFCVWNLEILTQSGGYWMPRLDDPDALFLTYLTPFEVAGGSHQLSENF